MLDKPPVNRRIHLSCNTAQALTLALSFIVLLARQELLQRLVLVNLGYLGLVMTLEFINEIAQSVAIVRDTLRLESLVVDNLCWHSFV